MNKKYWLLVIILLSTFWRFWSFDSRWILNQDQARDAIIGEYAIKNNLWPEIGPPSSAGPYNFGPWYYAVIMFWQKILPVLNGPWIGFGIMSVISVVFYYLAGGWISGIMAAVSVAMVSNSGEMLNTVLVGFGAAMTWFATKKLVETNKLKWGILVGFGVGLSINFHFQSLGLLGVIVAIVLVNNFKIKRRVELAITMGLGGLLAFLPLIIFDIKHQGKWILSVIDYFTVGVNKFYVPVRWLTDIRDFWPQMFGMITVGINNFGYVWAILALILIVKKIKINRFDGILILTLVIDIWLMRNYKGVRSEEYLIVFQGLIVLICGWITNEYYKLNKYFGLLILGIVVVVAGINNWQNIEKHKSQTKAILEIETSERINIEQYQQSEMISLPLFYIKYFDNKIGGEKTISVCDGNKYQCPKGEILVKNGYRIYDKSMGWELLTAENIYDRLWVNYGKN